MVQKEVKGSKCIWILGIIIILYILKDLPGIIRFKYYHSFFILDYPEKFIIIRYCFSIALRIFLTASVIGLFLKKDIFRRALIFFSFFNIFTLYWKHPVPVFRKIINEIFKKMAAINAYPSYVLMKNYDKILYSSLAAVYIVDILFSLSLIYFLTRPYVKKHFIR
ncbi:MAG: hypothetical protein B1H08_05050 [Candidatus Omnitrophica bacterium 4484_171]|nr:MAG: hypothetical protein B1H08_05050 [Candidatus Omnitrophica bacterium 4484_171]